LSNVKSPEKISNKIIFAGESYFYRHSFRTPVVCRNQLYGPERIRSLLTRNAERGEREERRKIMNGLYGGERRKRREYF